MRDMGQDFPARDPTPFAGRDLISVVDIQLAADFLAQCISVGLSIGRSQASTEIELLFIAHALENFILMHFYPELEHTRVKVSFKPFVIALTNSHVPPFEVVSAKVQGDSFGTLSISIS